MFIPESRVADIIGPKLRPVEFIVQVELLKFSPYVHLIKYSMTLPQIHTTAMVAILLWF